MNLPEFVVKVVDDVHSEVRLSLDGVALEQLMWRPVPQSNSMGWLAWHIARMQDSRAASISGEEQLWVSDGWHELFSMPPDSQDNGRGHTDEQVDSVRPQSAEVVRDYSSASHDSLRRQLMAISSRDEAVHAVAGRTGGESLEEILFRTAHGGLAHVGQLMYVRGLIEKRHWFPR
ncbi:MAG: DinB family protein [Dehalococcoidia bacterium]